MIFLLFFSISFHIISSKAIVEPCRENNKQNGKQINILMP